MDLVFPHFEQENASAIQAEVSVLHVLHIE